MNEMHHIEVVGVLAMQGAALDTDYLARWAEKLGLSESLERAIAAARS